MDSINLKKIAQVLGLSISTVSRALKNHPDISAITKRRVMETAESLNYVPNLNAVNLRSRNSRVFGVMVPSISNTFYVSFIDAVEEEARRNGYSLMILQSSDKAETELENIQIYRQNRIMGLFACITPNTEKLESFMNLKELNIPVLFFDKVPDLEHCNKVCLDDEGAGILAAETLLKYHKKNILALFGNEKISITRSRLKAFKGVFETSKDIFRCFKNSFKCF